MSVRSWAIVVGLSGCAGGDTPDPGGCPLLPDVDIVCADFEDYGLADFRIREADGTTLRTGVETAGQRDGLNLTFVQGNPGEVAQGLFACSSGASIDFREGAGSDAAVDWAIDTAADTECFVQVNQGGVLGQDVIQGTFAAPLVANGETRAINGSFHVGARAN